MASCALLISKGKKRPPKFMHNIINPVKTGLVFTDITASSNGDPPIAPTGIAETGRLIYFLLSTTILQGYQCQQSRKIWTSIMPVQKWGTIELPELKDQPTTISTKVWCINQPVCHSIQTQIWFRNSITKKSIELTMIISMLHLSFQ